MLLALFDYIFSTIYFPFYIINLSTTVFILSISIISHTSAALMIDYLCAIKWVLTLISQIDTFSCFNLIFQHQCFCSIPVSRSFHLIYPFHSYFSWRTYYPTGVILVSVIFCFRVSPLSSLFPQIHSLHYSKMVVVS